MVEYKKGDIVWRFTKTFTFECMDKVKFFPTMHNMRVVDFFNTQRNSFLESSIKEGLSKVRRQKKYDKIIERIGRLKERYNVGNLYTIKVEQVDGNATELQFTKNEQAQAKEDFVGTYVLRTNRLDPGGEEISKLHRSLTTIEGCFENMKGDLGLRPN